MLVETHTGSSPPIATNLNLKQNIIMETNFKELKEEIIKRAKAADACTSEYKRAYKSESFEELLQVIKDNFDFAVRRKVIDIELIKLYENEFNNNKIYGNIDISEGYLLVDNATVRASGNATVRAWGNATVEAWDNATVEAWGNATVEAWGNATVRAWGNATVRASGNATVRASGNAYITSYYTIECILSDNSIYRIRESNTIKFASDEIKFEKYKATSTN